MRRSFVFLGTLLALLLLSTISADAAKWSRRYIGKLPDSAFAATETTPEGKKLRHLPHHDTQGNLDVPHLCNALARLGQVKWADSRNARLARQHLLEHLEQVGPDACRPARGSAR